MIRGTQHRMCPLHRDGPAIHADRASDPTQHPMLCSRNRFRPTYPSRPLLDRACRRCLSQLPAQSFQGASPLAVKSASLQGASPLAVKSASLPRLRHGWCGWSRVPVLLVQGTDPHSADAHQSGPLGFRRQVVAVHRSGGGGGWACLRSQAFWATHLRGKPGRW